MSPFELSDMMGGETGAGNMWQDEIVKNTCLVKKSFKKEGAVRF
jgi:hypothetical protein